VAILDADKEGFLRSETSLVQTIGRSARNVNAKVILYADKVTESMQRAIDETRRRRAIQEAYNEKHNITPETIRKNIIEGIEAEAAAHAEANAKVGQEDDAQFITQEYINELEKEMIEAAEKLEFERAAILRDRIEQMQENLGKRADEVDLEPEDYPQSQRGRKARRKGKKNKRGTPHTGRPGGRVPKPERP
jgi:excinuclease ABC subunit B